MKVQFIILQIACSLILVNGLQVTLYEHKDRLGDSLKLKIRGCMNIPAEWDNLASSVDTHGDCIIFYEKQFCRGKQVSLQPYHKSHQMDLAVESLAFSDIISSVGPCGKKLEGGDYVIQNSADGSVLSVSKRHIFMHPWRPSLRILKEQQWKINMEEDDKVRYYQILPKIKGERKNPLSFEKSTLYNYSDDEKKTQLHIKTEPIMNNWYIESADNGRYRIRNSLNGKCLYAGQRGRVAQNWCDNWTRSQEWIFRAIPKSAKEKKNFIA